MYSALRCWQNTAAMEGPLKQYGWLPLCSKGSLQPGRWSSWLRHRPTCAGAVIFALIQAVEQGHAATYNTLLRAMRYSLKNGPQHFAKIPELSSSWDFDLNRPFLL